MHPSPFRPPQSELLVDPRSRPSRLWLAYGCLLSVTTSLGLLRAFFNPFLSGPLLPLFVSASLLNLCGLAGLWLYIFSKPFAHRLIWYLCCLLTVGQLLYVGYILARIAWLINWQAEKPLLLSNLLSLALLLPLPYALWCYASDSTLWHRDKPR